MLKNQLKDYNIILASGSPRRHKFFKDLELEFSIELKPIDEVYPEHLKGVEITNYLAKLKASAFNNLKDNDILVTSDTIVWHDGQAIGKPSSVKEAKAMVKKLSGSTHEVMTSVCFKEAHREIVVNCTTKVTFEPLEDDVIAYYIEEFSPLDKAGSYGIQDWIGLIGISYIEGSYANVVGLPTHLVYKTLLEITAEA